MHTHVSVHTGAVQADVNTKCHARPCRITSLAVETHLEVAERDAEYVNRQTHLVGLLSLQNFEHLFCLGFRRVSHGLSTLQRATRREGTAGNGVEMVVDGEGRFRSRSDTSTAARAGLLHLDESRPFFPTAVSSVNLTPSFPGLWAQSSILRRTCHAVQRSSRSIGTCAGTNLRRPPNPGAPGPLVSMVPTPAASMGVSADS